MSTSPEVREYQPDPIESIECFRSSHSRMVSLAFDIQKNPSTEGISLVSKSVSDAIWSLRPFVMTNFFRESGNELAVTASLTSVRNALEDLANQTEKLKPDAKATVSFDEPDTEKAADDFMELSDEEAEGRTQELCGAYSSFATNWGEIFLASPQIVDYALHVESAQKRKERLYIYGGTVIAAFAGTYLANKLQGRS